MTALRILGVDPGVTGGLAIVSGETRIEVCDIPTAANEINLDELSHIIGGWKQYWQPDFAVIERASSRPGQGVSSVFKFGEAYGMLRAVVAFHEIPTRLVTPSLEEHARALAIRLWPGVGLFNRKRDHGRAEAALLARYGVEVFGRQSS
jgi:hypothetical protein